MKLLRNFIRLLCFPVTLSVFGWDDIAMALMQAVASKAIAGSPPKSSQVGDAPALQPVDFSKLLAQAQQKPDQPKLQLQSFY